MDYTGYSTEDFLADESFQNYALGTDPVASRFWSAWLRQHPEKALAVEEAVAPLTALGGAKHQLPPPGTKRTEAAKLWAAIQPPGKAKELHG